MKQILLSGVILVGGLGCGPRATSVGGEVHTLTGYIYAPRSGLCATQAADADLPDLDAALDTIISQKPKWETWSSGFVPSICESAEKPVTSFKLLETVSDLGCTLSNIRGCREGSLKYAIEGTYQETKICSSAAKGTPPTCTTGQVFVPTDVQQL